MNPTQPLSTKTIEFEDTHVRTYVARYVQDSEVMHIKTTFHIISRLGQNKSKLLPDWLLEI